MRFSQISQRKCLSVAKLSAAFPLFHAAAYLWTSASSSTSITSSTTFLTNQRPVNWWHTDRHFEILVQGSLRERCKKRTKLKDWDLHVLNMVLSSLLTVCAWLSPSLIPACECLKGNIKCYLLLVSDCLAALRRYKVIFYLSTSNIIISRKNIW